ncbi:hypothetical protein EOD04_11185 [Mesorhizobium sp. M2C.T.Ca.TU.009.01.2.1]|nr:hypothetical protein EOD04_11185 [Mesorhizobium sp. M2C.T.Ca.TU.009.01.2.1]
MPPEPPIDAVALASTPLVPPADAAAPAFTPFVPPTDAPRPPLTPPPPPTEAPTPALTPPEPPTDAPTPTPRLAAFAGMVKMATIVPKVRVTAAFSTILRMTLSFSKDSTIRTEVC